MRIAREFDLMLLLATVVTVLLGVTMIYSAASASTVWKNQTVFAIVALLLAAAVVYVPERLFYGLAYPFYGVSLLLLVAVLVWGIGVPAPRWLWLGPVRVQPSEFAKLTTVLALARYLGDLGPDQINRPKAFVVALAIVLLPMGLVREQPDLGTAVSFGAALFPMLYWAGMRPMHLFFVTSPLLSVVFSFEPLWGSDNTAIVFAVFIIASSVAIRMVMAQLWVTLTMLVVNLTAGLVTVYLWTELVHGYQKARVLTLLDPERDPLGTGWNTIQSKIAIGSGGLTGKGFLHGTQAKYEFLPAAHTDFIFSVIGEELGFSGAVVVLSLFVFIIWRSLYIGTIANDRFFSLMAIGLASMIGFHVIVNIGMTVGVMPVTGLPLPFLSYGGSSLLTNCLAIGLLLHVYNYRHEY